MFGPLLNSFCQDFNLTMSDEVMLPKKSFTYVSDAYNTCNWIDHCVSSCAAHTSISKIEVLHNFITFDHYPLYITFNFKFFTQIAVNEPIPNYFNVKWSKVTFYLNKVHDGVSGVYKWLKVFLIIGNLFL